ncbi:hypothetical protein EVAR_18927_1 [Eumeta japonica]|uniref:Uncharacterized protein n=1 Tax=Eumeta variegata TaxID=151549 RepID=A0A4C1V3Z8_EUMVA|nr:hypothetical protein EVAR_18927_1 [Eumeta japonica]
MTSAGRIGAARDEVLVGIHRLEMSLSLFLCMYVLAYVRVYVRTCVRVCMHAYLHVSVRVCENVCVHALLCACVWRQSGYTEIIVQEHPCESRGAVPRALRPSHHATPAAAPPHATLPRPGSHQPFFNPTTPPVRHTDLLPNNVVSYRD